MKNVLRFILPLLVVLGVLALVASVLAERLAMRWALRDLEARDHLIVNTLATSLAPLLLAELEPAVILTVMTRATRDERLMAVGLCGPDGALRIGTESLPPGMDCRNAPRPGASKRALVDLDTGPAHVMAFPLDPQHPDQTGLILVHDLSYLTKRIADAHGYVFLFFTVLTGLVSVVTVVVARVSLRRWVSAVRAAMTQVGTSAGEASAAPGEIQPILQEVRTLVRELKGGVRERDDSLVRWDPSVLREVIARELAGDEVIAVSNREPYIHVRGKDGAVDVRFPASGLVSALDPVMRACGGTWVAHGSGDADREVADEHARVRVPPQDPAYTLRRVWLSAEEEQGYYYGFANEGIWPLSHLAHARPNFRGEDWQYYQVVNRKFADAVCQEVDGADPIVLVQDYHFALAPGYLRERLPRATVMMFWHIPWPNSERFGICPQRDELLEGMLGSSILGFHTQVDCNNFVDSVDRYLEARIDRERNAVVRHGRTTLVRPYPISLEWPSRWAESAPPVDECRATLRRRLGLSEQARIGVGVDRLDYTKGIEERLLAVERLLERFPEYVGQLTFVQLAAPSREVIDRYRQLREDVERQADRINARFGSGDYRPIVLLRSHHEPPEVFTCYRAADFCYVSSLHDGMNLVAKEFVAARDDELGVLVLSQFTGAARELPEALIVNPYDLEEASSAMAAALVMSPQEQRERIRSMRRLLADLNVYRWAGKMVIDAARLRGRDRLMGRLTSRFEDIHQEARRAGKHLVRSR